MTVVFIISSCTKTADGNLSDGPQNKDLEASSIEEKDFTESDEDLRTVNYKEFYDQLAPHGEWVQVHPEDIGLTPKTASFKSSKLGENDAYTAAYENLEMVYVWKPSVSLAVTNSEGQTPVYVPYSNGQWVNTDAGWYFKASTPVEETVSHYGRWVNSPAAGWLWVPGRVWAPAWVDWKQNDTHVSWAPLPPSVYMVNNTMSVPVIADNSYIVVEKKYFLEPSVYKYNNVYYNNGNIVLASELTRTDGIVIVNNSIINRGPDVNIIQTIYGRNIELVKIQRVGNFSDVKYSDREYYVYYPGFKRYKNKNKTKFTVNEPKSFRKYVEWQVKSDDKEFKKELKELRKDEKDARKDERKENNGKKQDGSDNGGKNQKDKGNKHNGNNNSNGTDNKHNASDDGNKHKDNDNKKGKK